MKETTLREGKKEPTVMQFALLLVSQYVHVVWIEIWIWQVIVIVQGRKVCFSAKPPRPTFKIPDFKYPYDPMLGNKREEKERKRIKSVKRRTIRVDDTPRDETNPSETKQAYQIEMSAGIKSRQQ